MFSLLKSSFYRRYSTLNRSLFSPNFETSYISKHKEYLLATLQCLPGIYGMSVDTNELKITIFGLEDTISNIPTSFDGYKIDKQFCIRPPQLAVRVFSLDPNETTNDENKEFVFEVTPKSFTQLSLSAGGIYGAGYNFNDSNTINVLCNTNVSQLIPNEIKGVKINKYCSGLPEFVSSEFDDTKKLSIELNGKNYGVSCGHKFCTPNEDRVHRIGDYKSDMRLSNNTSFWCDASSGVDFSLSLDDLSNSSPIVKEMVNSYIFEPGDILYSSDTDGNYKELRVEFLYTFVLPTWGVDKQHLRIEDCVLLKPKLNDVSKHVLYSGEVVYAKVQNEYFAVGMVNSIIPIIINEQFEYYYIIAPLKNIVSYCVKKLS